MKCATSEPGLWTQKESRHRRHVARPPAGTNGDVFIRFGNSEVSAANACERPGFDSGRQEGRKAGNDWPFGQKKLFLGSCLPAFLIFSWESVVGHVSAIGKEEYDLRHPRSNSVGLRRRLCQALLLLLLVCFRCSSLIAGDSEARRAFLADIAKQAAAAEADSRSVIAGTDGWLLFVPELRALSVGAFWGESAKQVSRSTKPEYADPLPAIVDFHDQLQKVGIELLIVPVPAKAAVYPESLSETIKTEGEAPPPRVDESHQEFYRLLKERGIAVLDLSPLFSEHRRDAEGPVYCKTDTHWSGRGIALAAEAIADRFQDRDWKKAAKHVPLEIEARSVEITGDLARMVNEEKPARETLPLTFVGTRKAGQVAPVSPDRASPVLLMGDSHTLIFHDPELFARGAGLPDHLARQFGFAVDLVGVRGSGASTTRIELLRRKDNLHGKKLVIWCFSFREFTESTTGWRKVPVIGHVQR